MMSEVFLKWPHDVTNLCENKEMAIYNFWTKRPIKVNDTLLERYLDVDYKDLDQLILRTSAFLKTKIFDQVPKTMTSRDFGVTWQNNFYVKMCLSKFVTKS